VQQVEIKRKEVGGGSKTTDNVAASREAPRESPGQRDSAQPTPEKQLEESQATQSGEQGENAIGASAAAPVSNPTSGADTQPLAPAGSNSTPVNETTPPSAPQTNGVLAENTTASNHGNSHSDNHETNRDDKELANPDDSTDLPERRMSHEVEKIIDDGSDDEPVMMGVSYPGMEWQPVFDMGVE